MKKTTAAILIVVFIFCSACERNTESEGLFIGFINTDNETVLTQYDIRKNDFALLKTYPAFAFAEECALANDETTLAYTMWDGDGRSRRLLIENLRSGETDEYYLGDNLSIEYPVFVNDAQLALRKTVVSDGFPNESICIFDPNDGREEIAGEVIDIITIKIDDDGNKTYGLTQDEFDKLLNDYGGEHEDIDKTGSRIFMKYSPPIRDYDGNGIYYSASLYRNAAIQGTGLVLASGIWH
ncbi:MAG: hypothetical protein LBL49_07250 [Clostridiales Family XIII bacterium]|nr:hypothetical protein [Clostridiales Family XIII bacterium]